MRVILIADVHANWPALLALQRAEQRPDAVLFAGDAVGYGPDPVICARWLLANTRLSVRGSHDEAMAWPGAAAGAPPELAEAAEATLAWTRQQLTMSDRVHLSQWPLAASVTLGGTSFYVCHGTPANPLNGVLHAATTPEAELHGHFSDVAADVIVLGHTHLPALRLFGRRVIVNPGSLGQPRYGVPDATYAIWDDGYVQIRHLHYDCHAVTHRLRLAPFSPEVLDMLSQTLETGMLPYGALAST